MVFDKYYDMWDSHGVKLNSSVEITKEVLDQVYKQCEVCDLVWAINAANQSNKSPTLLSNTVMGQIRKLLPLLLTHKSCSKYSGADVEERAVRHFRGDSEVRFKKRQPTIRNVLEGYINKNSIERNNTQSVADSLSQGEIPTKDEIQTICRQIARPGEDIAITRLKTDVEKEFQKQGRKLHPDWWETTKKNLRIWSEVRGPIESKGIGNEILRKKG